MTGIMTEEEEITDRGLMIEIVEDTLFRPKSRGYNIQRGSYRRSNTHRDKGDNRQTRSLPEDTELQHGLLAEIITDALVVDSMVIFPMNFQRRTLMQMKSNIGKKEPPSTKALSVYMKEDKKKMLRKKK